MAAAALGVRVHLDLQLLGAGSDLISGGVAGSAAARRGVDLFFGCFNRFGARVGVFVLRAARVGVGSDSPQRRRGSHCSDRDYRVLDPPAVGCTFAALPDLGGAGCVVVLGIPAPERVIGRICHARCQRGSTLKNSIM